MVVVVCVPTPIRARSQWSCPLPFSCEEFAPSPTHPCPFPPVSALFHQSAPAASVPRLPVRALSHPLAPDASAPHPSISIFSTSHCPPRPLLDQRAHAPNREHNLCAPVGTSRWRPFHPRMPPHVYKPVCTPFLITLLLSILAFNCTCS
jgi:hypothetical protein